MPDGRDRASDRHSLITVNSATGVNGLRRNVLAGTLPAYFNQLFSMQLRDCDPSSFYVPLVNLPPNQRADLICFGAKDLVQPWTVDPLIV